MYSYKRITKNSLSDIAALYKSCFNITTDSKKLGLKYNTSAFGEEYTGYVAIDESKEVGGYYGVFPCVVNYDDKLFMVGQSGDTMTSPDHRKKGLFTNLAKKTYDLAEEVKMAFVFGFPNENSLPGFERKLDWKFYGKMQLFTINSGVKIPLCEIAAKYEVFSSVYQSYVNRKLKTILISSSPFKLNSKNTILKDNNFFNYKKSKSTNIHFISMNEFKMVIKTDPHLMIGDVEPFEKEKLGDFLIALKTITKIVKARKTQIAISKNHWLYPMIENEIPKEDSLPIGFYEINKSIDCSKLSFSMIDFDTF